MDVHVLMLVMPQLYVNNLDPNITLKHDKSRNPITNFLLVENMMVIMLDESFARKSWQKGDIVLCWHIKVICLSSSATWENVHHSFLFLLKLRVCRSQIHCWSEDIKKTWRSNVRTCTTYMMYIYITRLWPFLGLNLYYAVIA